MVAAKIKRKKEITTVRTEFHVPLNRVLKELLDDDQVAPGDKWQFVQGPEGLLILRDRESGRDFGEDGELI